MTRKTSVNKKAIRNRMSQTNESYCVAMRKIEKLNQTPITVLELGEDADSWFIEGTTDAAQAKEALRKYFNGVYPDDTFLLDAVFILEEANYEIRYDWFWRPFLAEYPHDEMVLRTQENDSLEYNNQETFSGIHITA